MLRAQIDRSRDQYLLLDIGCFVHAIVVRLRSDFRRLEWQRTRSLGQLLEAMQPVLHRSGADAGAAVAQVAAALLWNRKEIEGALPEVAEELHAVRAGSACVLHFAEPRRQVDWAVARPRGAYAPPREEAELAGLFQATVYLRCYLDGMGPARRAMWDAALLEVQDSEAAADLHRCDAALQLLLGTRAPPMPGLPGPVELPDVAVLQTLAAEPGTAWSRLDQLFARVSVRAPRTVREAVLELAHTLQGEEASAALLQAMAPGQWHRKWADCAAYAYVGMRELDCLMSPVGIEPFPFEPRVLVEPVPRSWQALRRLAALGEGIAQELCGERGFYHLAAIDDAIRALAVQSRGETLDRELEQRLRRHLLWSFEADGPAAPIEIAGIGRLRRTGPHLARLPLHVNGRTVQALAFRLVVEHESGPGVWSPPPWGVELRPEALRQPAW